MTFNTGLSGLRAASTDLDVVANNIANVGTVGFKSSRVEFHDAYASAANGGGGNVAGSGVVVEKIAQQFQQGPIQSTENALDLAINGEGFFSLNTTSGITYTRQGIFRTNEEGLLVNNTGGFLQGYGVDDDGNVIEGIQSDLKVSNLVLSPKQTTGISTSFNLDSREDVLASSGSTISANGASLATAQLGTNNGYTSGSVAAVDNNLVPPGINEVTIPSIANLSAEAIAAEFSNLMGITATASTRAKIDLTNVIAAGELGGATSAALSVNGQAVALAAVSSASELATQLNSLAGISASLNGSSEIRLLSNLGTNLQISLTNSSTTVDVQGAVTTDYTNSGGAVTIGAAPATNTTATVGGEVQVQLESGYELQAPTAPAVASNIFDFTTLVSSPFTVNGFDPSDRGTYNNATSATIYDSLGNPHIVSKYFVKEPFNPSTPSVSNWSLYVRVDGQSVGDPVVAGGEATEARFTLQFDREGQLVDPPPTIVITNWLPTDANGTPLAVLQPINTANGGSVLPLPDPPNSSNFSIDITGASQFGADFAVSDLSQNGRAQGQLSGLEINGNGTIFARYSNGENSTIGQITLTNFNNKQGLVPIGDTSWVVSFESGEPVTGVPRTGTLGAIQSGALEASNVDLPEQLVRLIIAQQNYQANAKTIETADAIGQAIINLR